MIMRYDISLRHKYKSYHHFLYQRWKSRGSFINIQTISLTVPDMLVSKLHISVNARFNNVSICFLTLNKASVSCKVPLISLACFFASKNNKLHDPARLCFHVHSWFVQDWTKSRKSEWRKCTGKNESFRTKVPVFKWNILWRGRREGDNESRTPFQDSHIVLIVPTGEQREKKADCVFSSQC